MSEPALAGDTSYDRFPSHPKTGNDGVPAYACIGRVWRKSELSGMAADHQLFPGAHPLIRKLANEWGTPGSKA